MKKHRCVTSAAALFLAAGLAQAQFAENFDALQGGPIPAPFYPAGWTVQNNSVAGGLTSWFQGNVAVFGPFEGAGYLGTNFNNTTGTNTISNWMISPVTTLTNGAVLTFFTRTVDGPFFPDRLQVRMNKANTSTNVGTLPDDVGDFTDLLLDINPNYTTTGYPNTWTQVTATVTGVTGSVQGRLAFRYFVENGGPTGSNSDYIGIDLAEYSLTPPATGACCLPTGCSILTQSICTISGGTYAGNNVTCAAANCPPPTVWTETGDAGDLPGQEQIVLGSGPLTGIAGSLNSDVDMYQILICDEANFTATMQAGFDTQLFLFNPSGTGVAFNDDTNGLLSALTSNFVSASGAYLIAVSAYDGDALDSGGQEIWLDGPFGTERAPDGPGAANAVASWSGHADTGNYTIALSGSCFISGSFGACCLGAPSYSCVVTTQADCTTQGGTYAGNGVTCAAANCPPPPTGSCCLFNGTCQVLTQAQCNTQGGIYGGNNTPCGTCPTPYAESGDAGDLPNTAAVVSGSGTLIGITGTLGTDDADMFKIRICDEASFGASTVGLTTIDTQLFLFGTGGIGVVMDDDNPSGGLQSVITSQFVTANGEYYLAVSQYNKDPQDNVPQLIWNNTNPGGGFQPEWAPNGPGAANPIASWTATTVTGGSYGIRLGGSCYIGGTTCYADCDGVGGLTANDFACFLLAYTNNASYADCDGVGGLTANDFACFLLRYTNGCS